MRRSSAAADAAAAAVKQRQSDAVPSARGDDLFLRAVQRPRRGQTARILRRIRVADHDFLVSAMRVRYHGSASRVSRTSAGALKVGGGFKQRHDPLRMSVAGELLQQLDREDVRRAAGHRDDVGAE